MSTRLRWIAGLLALVGAVWGAGWLILRGPSLHAVQRGDTLSKLALRYDVTVDDLRRWNEIEGDLIEVGDLIWMWPQDDPPVEQAAVNGTRPAPRPRRRSRRTPDTPAPAAAVDTAPPPLTMPTARPCLAGPDGSDLGDAEAVASEGLTQQQASRALSAFSPTLSRCTALSEDRPSGVLELEITVACSGLVQDVTIRDRGDWPGDVARCMADTLQYAPFPPHDLPDGDLVVYPMRYQ